MGPSRVADIPHGLHTTWPIDRRHTTVSLYHAPMFCIVVKRGQFQRQEGLHKLFYALTPVVWDRRVRERRQADEAFVGRNRRYSERRGAPPASWQALNFVVVDRG